MCHNDLKRFLRQLLNVQLILVGIGITLSFGHSIPINGTWKLHTTTRNGNHSQLPEGDTLLLTVQGTQGKLILNPGNPGVAQSLIKSLCNKLYGLGKIVYPAKDQNAVFEISDIKGDNPKGYCPVTTLVGQLVGKEAVEKLQKRSLKFDFQYKTFGKNLTVTTTYKNEPVSLNFTKQ